VLGLQLSSLSSTCRLSLSCASGWTTFRAGGRRAHHGHARVGGSLVMSTACRGAVQISLFDRLPRPALETGREPRSPEAWMTSHRQDDRLPRVCWQALSVSGRLQCGLRYAVGFEMDRVRSTVRRNTDLECRLHPRSCPAAGRHRPSQASRTSATPPGCRSLTMGVAASTPGWGAQR